MANEKDNPGVIAPPPLIFLSGLLIGGLISWFYPIVFLPKFFGYVLGGIFCVFGLGIIFVVRSKMAKVETNIEPWKPTTAILSDGVYKISRNPVYVGLIFIYLGIVFLFNSLWILPPLILVVFVMHHGVILREEKYLEQKFGAEYLNYKEKVRRWI
jgi:protein-S-isoprenylcysteine O-methyltransferase Ste14